jgi:hypothetical protein
MKYIPQYRPAGCGTLPEGLSWEYVEWPAFMDFERADIPTSRHTYGVIKTERALTQDEASRFGLRPA